MEYYKVIKKNEILPFAVTWMDLVIIILSEVRQRKANMISLHSESEVTQLCPTLCDPMDCSLPSSSIHGILQARILEWIAISFSRGSSRPRDRTQVSHIGGRCFNLWATRKPISLYMWNLKNNRNEYIYKTETDSQS